MKLTRRLYLQVYAALLGTIVLLALVAAGAWLAGGRARHDAHMLRGLAAMASDLLPPATAPAADTEQAVRRLADRLDLRVALYSPEGAVLTGTGDDLPAPRASWAVSHWIAAGRPGPAVALRLDDGRWLVAAQERRERHGIGGLLALLVLAALAAAGAYPVARRITRRLERLQRRVDELGQGDLKARVDVEGRDEVADLARSFNQAADRIERLVGAQRGMLAGASHELRSPLARIRMAAELLGESAPPQTARQLARDVEELDELVGELLLASRLGALPHPERTEEVDLLALLAEECARHSAEAAGVPAHVAGDRRMLRRMLRNLLENARRYGGGSAVEASVAREDGTAVVRVEDRGPGVAEGEQERIFEPFYRPAGWREGPEGGVGLGLSLVRQIARHHGGDARWLAREGGGSCFEVRLPISP